MHKRNKLLFSFCCSKFLVIQSFGLILIKYLLWTFLCSRFYYGGYSGELSKHDYLMKSVLDERKKNINYYKQSTKWLQMYKILRGKGGGYHVCSQQGVLTKPDRKGLIFTLWSEDPQEIEDSLLILQSVMGKEALLEFFAWGPQTTMSAADGNHLKGKAIGENIFLLKKNLKKKKPR